MKKAALVCLALLAIVAGCANGNGRQTLEEAAEALNSELDAIFSDATLSEDEMMVKYIDVLKKAYGKHRDDSLGIDIFRALATESPDREEIMALYEESSALIHDNSLIVSKINAIRQENETAPGKTYKEVTGVNALSGEELSLSSFFEAGKPVLVDFWASWCSPCRQAIKNHLLDLAETGKVTIVGIAVWEDGMEDTQKAMEELGVSWPVIYAGGRENSPSEYYGVSGIPTMILIDTEGTIISRGHSFDADIAPYLQ